MELRQLQYFLAVASELNFTRAASQMHVVQSGLSASVAKLEKELGVELFDRSKPKIKLTPAGELFRESARHAVRAMELTKDSVRQYRGQLSGTVEIGGLLSFSGMNAFEVLGEFHRTYPFVQIKMRQGRSSSSTDAEAVANGSLDLALLIMPSRVPATVETRLLGREPMLFLCQTNHPLAQRDSVKITDLLHEELISSPPRFAMRQLIDDAYVEAGATAPIKHEMVIDAADRAALVRHGLGTTFMPAGGTKKFPDLRALPVTPPIERTIYLAWARGERLGPATAELAERFIAGSPQSGPPDV